MSRTQLITGIVLKAVPSGEADRLVTLLSPERGLVRAIAPGARKANAKLGGRTGLFVVNQLLLGQGRGLARIQQAETQQRFPGLQQQLLRLTAAQYLAELVLQQAVVDLPQADLFALLCLHLERLEHSAPEHTLARLTQALYHLLALEGLAPQVQACCLSGVAVEPPRQQPQWRIRFSARQGGILAPNVDYLRGPQERELLLSAEELWWLQQLPGPDLPEIPGDAGIPSPWPMLERTLRAIIENHYDRRLLSPQLLDSLIRSGDAAPV